MDKELINIRIALIKQISFVQERMSEIETQTKITIQQMADLERYARTLKFLSDTYRNLSV